MWWCDACRLRSALGDAAAGLQAWRGEVLALNDRLVDRSATVDAAMERLREATSVEQRNLLVPSQAPLWQTDFRARLWRELPRVPEELRSYARSTVAYIEGNPHSFVVQGLLVALLMFWFRRFATVDHPYSLAHGNQRRTLQGAADKLASSLGHG